MNKVLLLVFIAFAFAVTASAQITKGSIFLGGDVGGSTQKTKTEGQTVNKQSGIFISPVFGKAIKENLVLGVNAGFSIYNNETSPSPSNGVSDSKSYNAGVFLRKYKNIGASGFYIFIQGGVGVNYFRQELNQFYSYDEETKRTTIGLNAYPGISYAVSKKLHLETGFNNLLMLNYMTEKRETGNPGTPITTFKTNGFNLSSSLNNSSGLYVGFRLLIGK